MEVESKREINAFLQHTAMVRHKCKWPSRLQHELTRARSAQSSLRDEEIRASLTRTAGRWGWHFARRRSWWWPSCMLSVGIQQKERQDTQGEMYVLRERGFSSRRPFSQTARISERWLHAASQTEQLASTWETCYLHIVYTKSRSRKGS